MAALLFAGPALASKGASIDIAGKASFAEQREQVMADLADGETYAELAPEDREKVVAGLGRMQRLLGTHASASELHPNDRATLMNEQEQVNNILTQASKDSRLVCNRETPVGTRMPTTVCRTVAERRRLQDDSRRNLEAAGRSRAKLGF
ncbi:hypothetical protein [Luteimonas sp. A649]